MSNDTKKQFDFGAELDELEQTDWTPHPEANDTDPKPNLDQVRQIAEDQGFTSREPQPVTDKREPSDQVSIRGKASVIKRFKDLCKSQEPEWPQGFALEKLLDAFEAQQRG